MWFHLTLLLPLFSADEQLIVLFTRYLTSLERRHTLTTCLADYPHWYTLPSPFPGAASDFSVIYVQDELAHVKETILPSPLLRDVVPDRLISDSVSPLNHSGDHHSSNDNPSSSSYLEYFQRRVLSVSTRGVASLVHAPALWRRGYRGAGVSVAVLDTGLPSNHPHFAHIAATLDFTDESEPADRVIGHGTFVAGVIASSRDCLGIAPEAEIYSLKVFNSKQISHTSWFLEAFNYVLRTSIDILNLSIGGPDFRDSLFTEKVRELSARGIIFISAMGNDGPLYGTHNNPADQLDVIGVGGLNYDDQIAEFSSRGMTLWESPAGYGRVKPDIVTYGTAIKGSNLKGSCRYLTGTSVSSPVVTGVVALLVEVMKRSERLARLTSPAALKQVLMASADRLPGANVFEQGAGKMNLVRAYEVLQGYVPQVTVSPPKIDWTDCPYMWPFCSQPLYHTSLPVTVNMTVVNGMAVSGSIATPPTWHPNTQTHGQLLSLHLSYGTTLWPWSGYLAVGLTVRPEGAQFTGTVEGYILLTVTSPGTPEDIGEQVSTVRIPIKVNVIPTPPRHRRILWDQFHSIGYPFGPFPRDNLRIPNSPLDWNGDHPHTNFAGLYRHLRSRGYFVEVLGTHLLCYEPAHYGHLLIVDPEDVFHRSEVEKVVRDVNLHGMNLIVVAEWYNGPLIKHIRFYDENTQEWVVLQGAGGNVPALNKLFAAWSIVLSDKVWTGSFVLDQGQPPVEFASGTSILSFPTTGRVFSASLVDEASDVIHEKRVLVEGVPVLGVYHGGGNGSVSVFGDSSCLDSAGQTAEKCYWLLDMLLESAFSKTYSPLLSPWTQIPFRAPKLASTPNFAEYSRILYVDEQGDTVYRELADCPIPLEAESRDYNDTFPIGVLGVKLLSERIDLIGPEETEEEERLFRILGLLTVLSLVAVGAFLYMLFRMFHRKRIVLYKVRTRRRV